MRHEPQEILYRAIDRIHVTQIIDRFKQILGYEGIKLARSQYLYRALQPTIEDLLYLGNRYEPVFDRFEIIYALVFADINEKNGNGVWGPPGRFVGKLQWSQTDNSYLQIINEANQLKENWEPIKSGLFGHSYDRFVEISDKYSHIFQNRDIF